MIALFMCRSISSRPSTNGSIRTVLLGAPCSPLPDNRIALSDPGSGSLRDDIADARVSRELSDIEELQAVIGLWVARRGTGDQQGDGTRDLMLREPGPGKVAPVTRILEQLDSLHPAAKSQFLAHGRIMA